MQRLQIDAQQWAELNRLLDIALELPAPERERWLDQLDVTHAPLKPQLSDLLARAARIETRDFLNTLPKVGELSASERDQSGALIGPYRLSKELGAGGMGAVWLAERTDGLLKRPVALKLPHIVSSRAGLAERMAREREILGALTHPNIARLYDAGLTTDGRPYLALEFIEGLRIDAYSLQHALDVKARLRLFLQVANAVSYAHAQLVIHRDLKPANILVTADGEAKLLDFGVAKLLDDGQARSTQLTELSGRALTLDYAAPEQILGEPLTIAADVYSLGVVLFELLTNERPYRMQRESRAALEEAILTSQLRKPSDRVDRASRRVLAGDLDAIVMKALRRAPADRYDTVNAFAADITRYLERRPVLAQPERPLRNVAKFVSRHRWAVVSGAVAIAAIIAGAGIAVWQMLEARAQRDLAISQQQRALASSEFMTLLFEEVGPSGAALTPAELLDRGAQMLDAQYASDEQLAAYMLQEVSTRYAILGQVDRELALLTRVAATARKLNDVELFASSQCAMALAQAVTDAPKARVAYGAAQPALRSLATPATATQVTCLRARSAIEQADAQPERAVATLQEALSIVEAAPASTATAKIAVLSDLSEHYYVSDRSGEALDLIDRILQLQDASGRGGSMSKTITLMNRAAILSRMGEIRTAEADQREAIRLAERFGDDNLRIEFESHLATSLVRLSRCEEALPLLDKGVAAAARSGNARRAAAAQLLIGYCFIRLGRFADVEAPLARAEDIWNKNQSANRRMLNETALARAELKMRTGNARDAVADTEAIMRSVGYPATKRPPGISSILYRAALAHSANGNHERARLLAAESADAAGRVVRNVGHSADVGQARLIEAEALASLGNIAAARTRVVAAIGALEYGFGPDHPETRQARALEHRLATESAVAE